MTIHLPFAKWLARRFARPRPLPKIRQHLKVHQVLPLLPKRKKSLLRFNDDDSPPGHKVRWHH